jgi:hypothetical protein
VCPIFHFDVMWQTHGRHDDDGVTNSFGPDGGRERVACVAVAPSILMRSNYV